MNSDSRRVQSPVWYLDRGGTALTPALSLLTKSLRNPYTGSVGTVDQDSPHPSVCTHIHVCAWEYGGSHGESVRRYEERKEEEGVE